MTILADAGTVGTDGTVGLELGSLRLLYTTPFVYVTGNPPRYLLDIWSAEQKGRKVCSLSWHQEGSELTIIRLTYGRWLLGLLPPRELPGPLQLRLGPEAEGG